MKDINIPGMAPSCHVKSEVERPDQSLAAEGFTTTIGQDKFRQWNT